MTRVPRRALRLAALLTSLLLAAGLGEAALRVWYRDAGRRTLGGPGGRPFDHDTIDGELRGRRDTGPKKPGVPRIMIVGDSITYGLGVRDWHNTWPEILAHDLERDGRPHELAVFAIPGQDILQHVNVMREWDARVAPDVFIYQWYVNDIEAISHRPDLTRAWQRSPWHETLRRWSYMYFVLDRRLSQFLAPPARSYVDYLLTDFAPGTMEWGEFERQFHEFATRAVRVAPRRIMALYPQVPFRGRYPLQALNDRMRTLAGPHDLEIPPAAWVRAGGAVVADNAAPWKQAFAAPLGSPSTIETSEYVFGAGPLSIVLLQKRSTDESPEDTLAVLQLLDVGNEQIVGESPIRATGTPGAWAAVSFPFTLPAGGLRRVRIRIQSTGRASWALGDIKLPVDYGFEIVDFTDSLNRIQSHASAFDAHPNEAAQRIMADELYAMLTPRKP